MPARILIRETCIPPTVSHHRKRIVRCGGFARLADKPELVQAKATWDALFMPHRPAAPLSGPLGLRVVLTWPWRGSDTKRVRACGVAWHTTKPDTSNILKTVEDSLGRLAYFTSDAQICLHRLEKRRGDVPGIELELWEIEEAHHGGAVCE